MEKDNKVLVALLVGSLLLNFSSFRAVNQLKRDINQQVNHGHNSSVRLGNLENSIYALNFKFEEMKQDSRWIIKEEFIPNKETSSVDEINLELEWSFREIERDAKVYLLYSVQNSGEWKKVEAQKSAGSAYRAPLNLSPKEKYTYKIASEGNAIRSGEVKEIPEKYYRPMSLYTGGIGTSTDGRGNLMSFSTDFFQPEPSLFEFFDPKNVRVIIHYKGQESEIHDLFKGERPYEKGVYSWNLEIERFTTNPSLIEYEVEYYDGTIEKEKLWSWQ